PNQNRSSLPTASELPPNRDQRVFVPRTSASAIFRRRTPASARAFLLAASGHYVWNLDSLRRARFGNWTADDGARSVGRGRETWGNDLPNRPPISFHPTAIRLSEVRK